MANFISALVAALATLTFPAMNTLGVAVNSAVTTLSLGSAYPWLWPTAGNFTIQIDNEKFTVTAGHGTQTLTVTRAAGGTTAASHLINAPITWIVFPAARVLDGSVPTDVTTDAGKLFIQRIQTDGPAFKIGFPQLRSVSDRSLHSQWQCECVLHFGVPQNAVQPLVDLLSLLERIRTLLFLQATWAANAPSSLSDMSWRDPEFDYTQDPAFGTLRIMLDMKF